MMDDTGGVAGVPEMEGDTIGVMVSRGFSGEIVRATVTLSERIDRALPSIADQIGYESPDWERIGLYNLTADFEYVAEDTFASRDTRPGDLLMMADGQACHK